MSEIIREVAGIKGQANGEGRRAVSPVVQSLDFTLKFIIITITTIIIILTELWSLLLISQTGKLDTEQLNNLAKHAY